MKTIWRCITISTLMGVLSVLTGCEHVNTASQWWHVWRNPSSTSTPATLSSSKVTINLTKIASKHPAWKLAQQMESSPPKEFQLSWLQPGNISEVNPVLAKSTFPENESSIASVDLAEPEKLVTADEMQTLDAQMTQQQQSAWEKWGKNISGNLQEDRKQVSQAMQVDLNDQIDQTKKNIPKSEVPLTPSVDIQNEMINLRLKLLNNITLSADDKAAAQKRLDQLESQWTNQLRRQAQQGADKQQYWRVTVPRQLRQAGEANIQQTLQALQQQDQKTVDLTINKQQQWLEQDNAQNSSFLLQLPSILSQVSRPKSTFHAPVLLVKSITANFKSIPKPMTGNMRPVTTLQSEVLQLKQVAMDAAKRAASQSAARHHWQWTPAKTHNTAALPDATDTVLQEANF